MFFIAWNLQKTVLSIRNIEIVEPFAVLVVTYNIFYRYTYLKNKVPLHKLACSETWTPLVKHGQLPKQ